MIKSNSSGKVFSTLELPEVRDNFNNLYFSKSEKSFGSENNKLKPKLDNNDLMSLSSNRNDGFNIRDKIN